MRCSATTTGRPAARAWRRRSPRPASACSRTRRGACASGGHDFWLAGIGDAWSGADDLAATLEQVTDAAPVLAMTHCPDVFPEVPAQVALTVAGHTHGGQVRLPWLGALVVPSRWRRRYAYGHIVEHGRHLFVSRGLGHSLLPVRFLCPPEIALITLCHAAGRGGAGRGDEGAEPRRVERVAGVAHAGADVDAERADRGDRRADVVGAQAAREEHRAGRRPRRSAG